jgi:predicted kinase
LQLAGTLTPVMTLTAAAIRGTSFSGPSDFLEDTKAPVPSLKINLFRRNLFHICGIQIYDSISESGLNILHQSIRTHYSILLVI